MTCEHAGLDGAYVLGSLSPAERAEFERHLRTCDECARAVRELAGLPGLLARVPVGVWEQPVHEPVPDTLLPKLVAAAERDQRRRVIRTSLVAAAAVAAIALGSVALAAVVGDDDGPPAAGPPAAVETTAPPQRLTPVGDGRSSGWVSLTPTATGLTRVDLTCVYDSAYGGNDASTYKLFVYSVDGLVQQALRFEATPGEEVSRTGTTSIAADDIEKVVVKGSYGPILILTPTRTP